MQEQKTQTFRGTVENVKNVNTRSGRKMITFSVGGYPFKAFGEQAEAVEQLEAEHVEITAKHNTFHGRDEYAVVSIAGEMGDEQIKTTCTGRTTPTSPSNPLNLKNPGRHAGNPKNIIQRWILRFIDELSPEEWSAWSNDPRFIKDKHWPGYPEETKEHRAESAHMMPSEEEARLPDVKARFKNRLNEVRSFLHGKKSLSQAYPMQVLPIGETDHTITPE